MLLSKLLGLKNISKDINVKAFSKDCNDENVDLYFCLTDDQNKALERCHNAAQNGAKVIVSQFEMPFENAVRAENVRECFANASARFYGDPSKKL